MNTPQSGIIPPANSFACFLCLNINNPSAAGELLKSIQQQTQRLAAQHPNSHLTSVIGVGASAWMNIFNIKAPDGLIDFNSISNSFAQAPATQFDLILHIRSERHDINFELASTLMQKYNARLGCADETYGFRYLDNRDLTGFVDGTENPQTEEDRISVALAAGNSTLSQGSFIHIQRYIHSLPAWQSLPTEQQEDTIGRSKADNIEYKSTEKPLTAHIKRAGIKRADGTPIEILRHSMPYGNSQESGLFFISYAGQADSFPLMLGSMINGDEHGNKDHLLKYTAAITGAAFYAPPIEFLEDTDNYL